MFVRSSCAANQQNVEGDLILILHLVDLPLVRVCPLLRPGNVLASLRGGAIEAEDLQIKGTHHPLPFFYPPCPVIQWQFLRQRSTVPVRHG